MRIAVDLTRCQGYAQCAFLAPDVFRMRGDEALMYNPEPDDTQRERVLGAAAACPVQALRVDHIDDRDARVGAVSAPKAATMSPQTPSPDASGPTAAPWRDAVMEAFRHSGRIVIVGASLAGARPPRCACAGRVSPAR